MNPIQARRATPPLVIAAWLALCTAEARAQYTVTIVDDTPYKPAPVDTKNVGQEIKLRAVVTGGIPMYYDWKVEGEVVQDYNEMEPGPFSITDLPEAGDPPAWFPGGPAMDRIAFFWRESGTAMLPAKRIVHVLVVFPDDLVLVERTFTVERNMGDANRQAEDYYTRNHNGRVLIEHYNWHDANPFGDAAYNGAEFFDFHRRFLARYSAWRAQFGYPALGKYDPAVAIPAMEAGYTLAEPRRAAMNPNTNVPDWYPRLDLAKPPWFTVSGDGSTRPAGEIPCEPAGGQRKLMGSVGDLGSGFTSYAQLGCAVTHTWHNAVHVGIGGPMNSTAAAPEDPIFWRWHNFLGDVATDWLTARAELPALPPDLASATPPAGYGVGSLTSVSVSFAEPVTGLVAANLAVDGSAATSVAGSGAGPYVFSGFAAPAAGEVSVTLAPGSIIDTDGEPFGGDTWSYTIAACVDADLDGVCENQSWPTPSFDNCPSASNPDQADSDDDQIGDACDAADTPMRAMQAVETDFGDNTLGLTGFANGSELDMASAGISGGYLHLVLEGNLESNFNKLEIFFDSKAGGQNRLLGNNPDVDFNGLNRMGDDGTGNGLTFDAGFGADFWIGVTGGDVGGTYTMFVNYAELLDGGGGAGYFVGSTGAATDGNLTGGTNPFGIRVSIDNSNTAGVVSGCAAGVSGHQLAGGIQLAIPLSALENPAGGVGICVAVNGMGHDYLSNQFLAPLPPGTCALGEPRTVSLESIAGLQHFIVDDDTSSDTRPSLEPRGRLVAWPSPFRAVVFLDLRNVLVTQDFTLDVFDIAGRRVRSLSRTPMPRIAVWDGTSDDGRRVAAGLYFVRMRAGSVVKTARVVRIR